MRVMVYQVVSVTIVEVIYFIYFIEKLRLFAHVVGSPSHKGIARRALPASGVKDEVGGNIKVNKGE